MNLHDYVDLLRSVVADDGLADQLIFACASVI